MTADEIFLRVRAVAPSLSFPEAERRARAIHDATGGDPGAVEAALARLRDAAADVDAFEAFYQDEIDGR